jgi:L-threonylcarbamoyladenylate synthase
MTVVLATQENIRKASQVLSSGGVVAFPTETVYGLGCDATNKEAVSRVYTLKNRPNDNPLIAHVSTTEEAKKITIGWDDRCDQLAERFWPGPLTIILKRGENVPKEACGGTNTIAVRCPNHETAKELLKEFGGPISAPSANISGHTSPTTATHVHNDFGDELFVLDGGACDKGIESTVISMVGNPTVLRLGSIEVGELLHVISGVIVQTPASQNESPGSSDKHYAPNARMVLQSSKEISKQYGEDIVFLVIKTKPASGTVITLPTTSGEYAKLLYAAIREADAMKPKAIHVEHPPNTPEWEAINDRLRRASS